jgi:hypothetical protein
MTEKLSKIGKWIFAVLALVTVAISVYYYLDLTSDSRTSLILNWGYIMIGIGIFCALVMPIVSSFVTKPNVKKILIAIAFLIIIAAVSFFMSKNAFAVDYVDGEIMYPASTNGWVEFGLNFFYVTFVVSIIVVLFSVIKSGK